MNFKRNCFTISLVALTSLLLTSCGEGNFTHYTYFRENAPLTEDVSYNEGKYIKYKEYAAYRAKALNESKILGSATEVFRNYSGRKHLNTTGDNKIIVVPVDFSDYKCLKTGINENKYINDLENAFFGVSSNNKYVSVAEYFNVSSYGKLRLDGTVCDKFYRFSKSISEIKETKSEDIRRDIMKEEYPKILKWYQDNYGNLNDYSISELHTVDDVEKRKDIPLYLVYTYPADSKSETSNNFFWAYTFSDFPVSLTSFSSLSCQYENPDSHTLIHETGHLLGLSDYYPTAKDGDSTIEKMVEPTARIDMMDCSIGDETGFSKMLLNWTMPYHVVDSTDIELKPFVNDGELILLNDSWNKTAFDEYYLIELYTPTKLNTYDSTVGNSEAILPSLPSIKIYHVDSRLAYFSNNGNFHSYCSEGKTNPELCSIDLAHNNYTYANPQNRNQNNYLYDLILNGTDTRLTKCAKNGNLFHAGDVIKDLKMNSGKDLDYKITINSLTFKKASLTIEKIAKN